jgi:hypothetical protein
MGGKGRIGGFKKLRRGAEWAGQVSGPAGEADLPLPGRIRLRLLYRLVVGVGLRRGGRRLKRRGRRGRRRGSEGKGEVKRVWEDRERELGSGVGFWPKRGLGVCLRCCGGLAPRLGVTEWCDFRADLTHPTNPAVNLTHPTDLYSTLLTLFSLCLCV